MLLLFWEEVAHKSYRIVRTAERLIYYLQNQVSNTDENHLHSFYHLLQVVKLIVPPAWKGYKFPRGILWNIWGKYYIGGIQFRRGRESCKSISPSLINQISEKVLRRDLTVLWALRLRRSFRGNFKMKEEEEEEDEFERGGRIFWHPFLIEFWISVLIMTFIHQIFTPCWKLKIFIIQHEVFE